MRYVKIVSFLVVLTLFSGCCCMSPSANLIDQTPVIKVGSTEKPPKDFILFIPANTKFPMNFLVSGDAFDSNETSKVMVSFKKDVYLYDRWASSDGKNWVDFHSMFDVRPLSGFSSMGAHVRLKIDYAK